MKTRLEIALKTVDETINFTFKLPEDSEVKVKIKRVLIARLQDIMEMILKLEYFLDELEECKSGDQIISLMDRDKD